jgi:hypothetical protein
MRLVRRMRNRQGGVILDSVLSLGIVLVGAFCLESLGISFSELLHGALRFFGH